MSHHNRRRTTGVLGDPGFTLIELLVVIIIIAILAAIGIPIFLGSRIKAQDVAAVALVRNALTVVESANVEYHNYAAITAADLGGIEPAILWIVASADLVDPSVPTVTTNVTAQARNNQVNYYGQAIDTFDVGTTSESDNRFGIQVHTTGAASADYVKVKVIEGTSSLGW